MFLVVIIFLVIFFCFKKKKSDDSIKSFMEIPGPKGYPIIGTEYPFSTSEQVFEQDRMLANKYFPIYKRYSFGIKSVVLMHPEDMELVLNNPKHIEKSIFYDFLHDWLGSGLLTSKGENWHKRRKILTPAFHFSILQEFVDIFNKEVDHLVEDFKKICDQPYINVTKPITEFTLYSIGETSLGKDLREDPKCTEYKQAVYDYGENFIYRVVRPWLYSTYIYELSSVGKNNKKTVETLHAFSNNIIRERYKLFGDNGQITYTDRKRLALLDLMIKAKYDGADIDDVGIREEVDTFILGGHDTTAVSLCHTLMILANEPDIQEEIYQEIMSVVGDSKHPSFADLGELKYTERCIKESLRIYPSVAVISRITGEDIQTKTGYKIEKGCIIGLPIIDMHKSPEIYEDPETFNPDRFLPESISKRHPYSYLPFSAGSRNCIGQKYAMLELKAALCGLIKNFILKPVTKPSDIRYKADLVLRPDCEIRIKFIPRK